jgi:large subunit ribosomal protein L30
MSKVRVTLIRSLIGCKEDHRRTVRALGLRRLNSSVVKEQTPQIAGMIRKVRYLVKVEETAG